MQQPQPHPQPAPVVKPGFSIMALFALAADVMAALPQFEAIVKDLQAGKMPTLTPQELALLAKLISDGKAVFA